MFIGDHAGCSRAGFLGGLEEKHDAAFGRALGRELSGKTAKDRHVAVMAAEMALAIDLRAPAESGDLGDRQSVEFAPEEDGRAIGTAVVDGGNAMAAQARENLVRLVAFEFGDDTGGGMCLLAGKLGLAMKFAPQRDELFRRCCEIIAHPTARRVSCRACSPCRRLPCRPPDRTAWRRFPH